MKKNGNVYNILQRWIFFSLFSTLSSHELAWGSLYAQSWGQQCPDRDTPRTKAPTCTYHYQRPLESSLWEKTFDYYSTKTKCNLHHNIMCTRILSDGFASFQGCSLLSVELVSALTCVGGRKDRQMDLCCFPVDYRNWWLYTDIMGKPILRTQNLLGLVIWCSCELILSHKGVSSPECARIKSLRQYKKSRRRSTKQHEIFV